MTALRPSLLALAVALLVAAVTLGRAEDEPELPPGISVHELHGFTCAINMPPAEVPADRRGLLLALHMYDGDAEDLAYQYRHAARDGYVVVAPVWQTESNHKEQVEIFHAIVRDLRDRFSIPDERLHCLQDADGYSTLQLVAFAKDPAFRTATWTRGYFRGGKIPRHVRDRLGLLMVSGDGDRSADLIRRAAGSVVGKVRAVDVHVEPGVDRVVPVEFMKRYYVWWLRMQEGAYEPGKTLAFDWCDPPEGHASFTYWWSATDSAGDAGRAVQTGTLHDPLVQWYGDQLAAGMREREKAPDDFAAAGATTTPAIVVRDAKGKIKKVLEGDVDAKALAAALRAVAPEKKKPW